jgi:hypothetical protein
VSADTVLAERPAMPRPDQAAYEAERAELIERYAQPRKPPRIGPAIKPEVDIRGPFAWERYRALVWRPRPDRSTR